MDLSRLSDQELVARLRDSLISEREHLLEQLFHLAEMDERKLTFHCSSLWQFLTQELGMEESQAYRRITAARMLRRFPKLATCLQSGKLNLTLVSLAEEFFRREKTPDSEQWECLEALFGKSCRSAERELLARSRMKFRIPRERERPVSEALTELNFVADGELLAHLEKIRGLLAHTHPKITLSELVSLLAQDYLNRHDPEAKAMRSRARRTGKREPEPTVEKSPSEPHETLSAQKVELDSEQAESTRRAPRSLVHQLILEEGYRCGYRDPATGKVCGTRYGLELDHARPWALGGKTERSNTRFRCRAHNLRAAIVTFGIRKMRLYTSR